MQVTQCHLLHQQDKYLRLSSIFHAPALAVTHGACSLQRIPLFQRTYIQECFMIHLGIYSVNIKSEVERAFIQVV